MDTTIKKPNGDITAYGFACGYIQRNGETTLYKDGVYHVRDGGYQGYWETFRYLSEARNDYARLLKAKGVEVER
jgi:hypothetical protein